MNIVRVDPVTAWGTNGPAHGPHSERILSVDDIRELVARRVAGWGIDALATAYGIDKRTVHRWKRVVLYDVEVAGYRAVFATGHENSREPVIRLTKWQRVESAA